MMESLRRRLTCFGKLSCESSGRSHKREAQKDRDWQREKQRLLKQRV